MTPSTAVSVIRLTHKDIERIVALETRCFIPPLQVAAETVRRRLDYEHFMYGAEAEGELVGLVCFSYGCFDPMQRGAFPPTLKELCCQPPVVHPNAVFIYNLELVPQFRGLGHYRQLLRLPMDQAKRDGLCFAVGNGRVPSYAGSIDGSPYEHVRQHPEVRDALDQFLAGGPFPDQSVLMRDPLLASYQRLLGGDFHWILPNFAPDDTASGGIRVIGYRELASWS